MTGLLKSKASSWRKPSGGGGGQALWLWELRAKCGTNFRGGHVHKSRQKRSQHVKRHMSMRHRPCSNRQVPHRQAPWLKPSKTGSRPALKLQTHTRTSYNLQPSQSPMLGTLNPKPFLSKPKTLNPFCDSGSCSSPKPKTQNPKP